MKDKIKPDTYFYIESPPGKLEAELFDSKIIAINYLRQSPTLEEVISRSSLPLVKEIKNQFLEYFSGKRFLFDLPLSVIGTSFQQSVWAELQRIPYGKTISYAELARRLGNPKCIRAAGSANGKNPISIIIPCHRVIGSDGSLIGYGGGIDKKQWLLEHENFYSNGKRLLF